MKKQSFTPNVDEVTFGVEIECCVPHRKVHSYRINIGSHSRGLPCPSPFPDGWVAESDSSIVAPSGYAGIEFVSPILKGLDGLVQVCEVIALLERMGTKVNQSCGFHVHVGAKSVLCQSFFSEETAEWVRRLLHLVAHYETALLAITGEPSRCNNFYCASTKGVWERAAGKSKMTYIEMMRNDPPRYHILNTNNLFTQKKTIEFRVFAGTMNADKIVGYIVTAIGLCIKAAKNTNVVRWDSTETLLTSDANYYVAAVKHLQGRLCWGVGFDGNIGHGWPTGAWERWGAAVRKNQIWNAKHFAGKVRERRQNDLSE